MDLTAKQEAAVRAASEWVTGGAPGNVFRLFGYAGTGKTTVARHIKVGEGKTILYGAYTGKAASVLTSKGCPARTLHSLIYIPYEKSRRRLEDMEARFRALLPAEKERRAGRSLRRDILRERSALTKPGFVLNTASDLTDPRVGALVVDEVSMVDKAMADDLLSFEKPLVVLGDPAQLPPVGGEGELTKVSPDVLLEDVLRHSGGRGGILDIATRVRQGNRILDYDALTRREARSFDIVLCGRNATRWRKIGQLREMEGRGAGVEAGDKVICVANKPSLGIFNGQTFRVVSVGEYRGPFVALTIEDDASGDRYTVWSSLEAFGGEAGEKAAREGYGRNRDVALLTFGQALTVHKAQGSEWDRVVVIDESRVFRDRWRSWMYTAVTRARSELRVIRPGK
jgi:exodeoxyribonuclease-5